MIAHYRAICDVIKSIGKGKDSCCAYFSRALKRGKLMKMVFYVVCFSYVAAIILWAQSPTPTPFSIGAKLPALVEPTPVPTPAPHMLLFGMTPYLWADLMKAWVMGIADVLDLCVSKVGVLGLAIIAVWQNLKQRAVIQEVKDRQDRQGQRVDAIALAVPAITGEPQEVKVVNDPAKPEEVIPVSESPLDPASKSNDTPPVQT